MDDISKKSLLRRLKKPLTAAVLILLLYAGIAGSESLKETANKLLRAAEQTKKNMKIPENKFKEQGKAQAEKLYKIITSEKYQQKINNESKRLTQEVFAEQLKGYDSIKDDKNNVVNPTGTLSQSERIYIFVSSSIPKNTLRNYAEDIDRLSDPNIKMVMRGFIGGMKFIKPTLEFIGDITKKDKRCDMTKKRCNSYRANFQIDPLLFRRFNIKKVPAAVYVPEIKIRDPDLSEGLIKNAEITDHYSMYGDAALTYVIKKFQEETKKESLKNLFSHERHEKTRKK